MGDEQMELKTVCDSLGIRLIAYSVKSIRHVEENLGALGWRLSPAEISELESAAMAAPKKMIQNVFQTA
nr:unnamed protein product [Digitaria exilis]